MTHLSDLSFLQRIVMLAWFLPWYIIHIYRHDRFEAFRLKRLLRLELRSLMTLQLFLALLFLFVYDIGTARIKYWEGFWQDPRTHEIVGKPTPLWSEANQEHVQPLYYILSLALAFQNCVNFLLQSWWHYITSPKDNFQSSFEFRIHILASVLVLITYPLLQYLLHTDVAMREAVPQLVFSTMLIFLAILGVRTHLRLKRLLKKMVHDLNEHNLVLFNKLDYFSDINKILAFTFLIAGITLGILSIDGMTESRVIAHSKFGSDFLACNLNFVQPIMWTALTLLIYPRKSLTHGFRPVSANGAPIRMVPGSSQGLSVHRNSEQTGRPYSHGSLNPKDAPFQMEMSPRNTHEESQDFIPYVAPASPPPAAIASQKRPSRPRIETTTLYYHEGLARQAREQLSPPPLPRSTENLLKDTEANGSSDDYEMQARPMSPNAAVKPASDSDIVQLASLRANQDGHLTQFPRGESDDDPEDAMERPLSRTRVKPDTQALALHYGPLYHQQYQSSLDSTVTPSSSSTTMVSCNSSTSGRTSQPPPLPPSRPTSKQRSHSKQPSDASMTQQRIRPVSPITIQPFTYPQQPIYLSNPLQFKQQYDTQYDQPLHSPRSPTDQRRISPPPPPRGASREKRSMENDANVRAARHTSANVFSLRIMPQHAQAYVQQQQQQQHTEHPAPTSYAPKNEAENLCSTSSSDLSGGAEPDSSTGEITIQLQQPVQRPFSPQQEWI